MASKRPSGMPKVAAQGGNGDAPGQTKPLELANGMGQVHRINDKSASILLRLMGDEAYKKATYEAAIAARQAAEESTAAAMGLDDVAVMGGEDKHLYFVPRAAVMPTASSLPSGAPPSAEDKGQSV